RLSLLDRAITSAMVPLDGTLPTSASPLHPSSSFIRLIHVIRGSSLLPLPRAPRAEVLRETLYEKPSSGSYSSEARLSRSRSDGRCPAGDDLEAHHAAGAAGAHASAQRHPAPGALPGNPRRIRLLRADATTRRAGLERLPAGAPPHPGRRGRLPGLLPRPG